MTDLLQVQNMSRSFGGLQAVKNLSFSLQKGKIKGIIGPNGAGKTTLFNLISGMLIPDSGSVYFNNSEIQGKRAFEIADLGIARTFQAVSLFENMLVLENVMVGRHCRSKSGFFKSSFKMPSERREEREIQKEARKWLEFVGISGKDNLPVSELPFKEQKLVEFARALATEPQLLLLDEPAAGFTAYETNEIAKLILKIRDAGITVLIIEHDMGLVMKISDEIVVLNYGEKIAEGNPGDIQENPDVINVYLGRDVEDAEN